MDFYLQHCAECGNLELIKQLEEALVQKILHGTGLVPFFDQTLRVAAKKGHLHIVQYMHDAIQKICLYDYEQRPQMAVEAALRGGHLEVMKYFHEKYKVYDASFRMCISRFTLTGNSAIKDAVEHNKVSCVQYLLENCHPICEADRRAIQDLFQNLSFGNLTLETVRFLYEQFENFIEPLKFFNKTAKSARREIYQFVRDRIDLESLSLEFLSNYFENIAKRDDLDLFLYVRSDLIQRVPKFQEWWPQLSRNVFKTFREYNQPSRILEYFLAHVLSVEEIEAYFLENKPTEHDTFFLWRKYTPSGRQIPSVSITHRTPVLSGKIYRSVPIPGLIE